MPFHSRAIAVHHIGNRPATKPLHEFYLDVAATGCVKQEPPYKCQPQATEICTGEKAVKPKHDKHKGHRLAHLGCQSCRAIGVMSDPPNQSSQHTTAIERIPRNHVEYCQHDIDVTKPEQHSHDG